MGMNDKNINNDVQLTNGELVDLTEDAGLQDRIHTWGENCEYTRLIVISLYGECQRFYVSLVTQEILATVIVIARVKRRLANRKWNTYSC